MDIHGRRQMGTHTVIGVVVGAGGSTLTPSTVRTPTDLARACRRGIDVVEGADVGHVDGDSGLVEGFGILDAVLLLVHNDEVRPRGGTHYHAPQQIELKVCAAHGGCS